MLTLREVREKHRGHWFDRDTMRFFGTRLCRARVHTVPGPRECAVVFVTSERGPMGGRRYSVRVGWEDSRGSHVDTVGTFCGYATRREALRAAALVGAAEVDAVTDGQWRGGAA